MTHPVFSPANFLGLPYHKVKNVTLHPSWEGHLSFPNNTDLAIVEANQNITFNAGILPICMPAENRNKRYGL